MMSWDTIFCPTPWSLISKDVKGAKVYCISWLSMVKQLTVYLFRKVCAYLLFTKSKVLENYNHSEP